MRFPIPLGIEARHFSSLSIHRTQFSSAFTLDNCEVAEFLSFSYVRFHGPVSFHNSVFRGRSVIFTACTFDSSLDLSMARFHCPVVFDTCTFKGPANFNQALFQHALTFRANASLGLVDFSAATFEGESIFAALNLSAGLSFVNAVFDREVELFEIYNVQPGRDRPLPSIDLSGADFRGRVTLRQLYPAKAFVLRMQSALLNPKAAMRIVGLNLASASFVNTNLNGAGFHDCSWPQRHGRFICFDELTGVDDLDGLQSEYHQLSRLHRESGRLREASDFYYRAMEVERRRYSFLGQYVSMHSLYGLFSGYGESYWRPLLGLLAVWLGLAVVVAAMGGPCVDGSPTEEARAALTCSLRVMSFGVQPRPDSLAAVSISVAGRWLTALQLGFVLMATGRRFAR